ncbi:MAG: histidine kinase [Bacteroidota bacterium]
MSKRKRQKIGKRLKNLYRKVTGNIVLLNLFWWSLASITLTLNVQISAGEGESIEALRWSAFVTLGYIMVPTVYFHNLVTLQKFFLNKRWILGILSFFGYNVIGGFTLPYVGEFLDVFVGFFLEMDDGTKPSDISDFTNTFGLYTFVGIVGMMAQLARFSFLRHQKAKEAELSTLKSQLNPHFLFNSLNNLYGLSVTKSDKLPGLMLRLSDLLRYSLYDTQTERVPLSKEIDYLINYVELERIRLEDTVEIELALEGDPEGKYIVPLLLIPFIENAFKHHGPSQEYGAKINIQLKIEEKALTLDCYNTIDPAGKRQAEEVAEGGIGTENTQKRLALLYPKAHSLVTEKTEDTYRVQLSLPLTT